MSNQYTSSITLYQGCPFDMDYNYVLSPVSKDDKKNWLNNNLTNATYTNLMFVRFDTGTGAGTVRLNLPRNQAVKYDYAYINNNNYGTLFAFVTGCTYINDGNSSENAVYELSLQKDLFATHLVTSSSLKECSIIRHHSTPSFTNPYVSEPFQGGRVQVRNYNRVPIETNHCYNIILYVSSDPEDQVQTSSSVISHVPCGTSGIFAGEYDYAALNNTINDVAKKAGNIGAIYTAPMCLFDMGPAEGGGSFENDVLKDESTDSAGHTFYSALWSVPLRNNKCCYYPYNFYRVWNDAGEYMDLKWEYWNSWSDVGRCLSVEGCALQPVSVSIYPREYEGASSDGSLGYNRSVPVSHCKLTMGNYPTGAWASDAYYSAIGAGKLLDLSSFSGFVQSVPRFLVSHTGALNNAVQSAQTIVKDTITQPTRTSNNITANQTAGNIAAAGMQAVTGVADYIMTETAAIYQAPEQVGSVSSPSSNYSNGHKYFYTSNMCLSSDDMRALDTIFDKFGYAQGGIIATPDLHYRPRWTYLQTGSDSFVPEPIVGCNALETRAINNALKRGVTFWTTLNSAGTIGDYTQDNGADTIRNLL